MSDKSRCAPPSSTAAAQPPLANDLWQRLPTSLRQQLCQVLSLLVARRLLPGPAQEVTYEAR